MPHQDPTQHVTHHVAETQTEDGAAGQAALDADTKNQLLSLVLGETLSRRREDPAELVRTLKDWRREIVVTEFDQSSCEGLVGQVLLYRLGSEAEKIPAQLRQEVGEVLWSNPDSQSRLRRLWTALGQDH